MVGYRRNFVPGGTYFFTVTLQDRKANLLTQYIDHLRQAFRKVRIDHSFQIDAIVILPEHLHTIWTLPDNDADYPGRWRAIKSQFTRSLKQQGLALKFNSRGVSNVWQARFWEHTIKDAEDLQRHIDYLHYNPVKHGLTVNVSDWPHSSFHRYVKTGLLPPDWGTEPSHQPTTQFGE